MLESHEEGQPEILSSWPALCHLTVRLSGRVTVAPPPVAVIVTVDVPVLVPDAAFNVMVLVPLPGAPMLAGEKVAVTPFGKFVTPTATDELNPFTAAVVATIGIDPPRFRIVLVPASDRVIVGPTTVRLIACVLLMPPPNAVTVSGYTPPIALAVALTVRVLLPVPGKAMLAGEKLAVTPEGSPPTVSPTADENPLDPVVFSVTVEEFPSFTVTLAELVPRASAGTVVVSLTACVCVMPPPVAFTTRLAVPLGTFEAALSVSVLVPLPGDAMLVGEKLALTPEGNPIAESVIADLKPLAGVVVIVSVVDPPAAKDAVATLLASEKLGAATVIANEAVRVRPPPVAVSVIVLLPTVAFAAAETVTVTAADCVRLVDENFTVTFEGTPLAERVTAELNPPCPVSATVAVAELPGASVTLETLGLIAKSILEGLLQLFSRIFASTDPSPVDWS